MDKLNILNDDRIEVVMDATDSTIEQLIAVSACSLINCNKCPIRERCDTLNHFDCVDVWRKYLEGEL